MLDNLSNVESVGVPEIGVVLFNGHLDLGRLAMLKANFANLTGG